MSMNNNTAPPTYLHAYRYFKPAGMDRNAFANAQTDMQSQWNLFRGDRAVFYQQTKDQQTFRYNQSLGLPQTLAPQGPVPAASILRSLQNAILSYQNMLSQLANGVLSIPGQIRPPSADQVADKIMTFFFGSKRAQNQRDEEEKEVRDQSDYRLDQLSKDGIIEQPGAASSGASSSR